MYNWFVGWIIFVMLNLSYNRVSVARTAIQMFKFVMFYWFITGDELIVCLSFVTVLE